MGRGKDWEERNCLFARTWKFDIAVPGNQGRFPFNQKFRRFLDGKRMERQFPGMKFRNFRTTWRGYPKIPENRNNRKILFHSTIPARALFLLAGIERIRTVKMASKYCKYQCSACLFPTKSLQLLLEYDCSRNIASTTAEMISFENSSYVSLVIRK